MTKALTLPTLALLAGPLLAGAPLAAQTFPVEREFRVSSGQLLDVDLDTGGSVRIVGGTGSTVRVRATPEGSGCGDCRVEVEQAGGTVRVHSSYAGDERRGRSSGLRLEVEVPQRFDVRVGTMGGEVSIDNVTGDISGKTMGGGLTLSRLGGRVELTTMGGEVRLTSSTVDGRVHTMGGNVVMEDVGGGVRGSTMGGTVTQRRVGAGASGGGEVRIHTMGGAINVDEAPAGADVQTMGGGIRIRAAAGSVRAKTMGGDIRIDAVDGSVRATTMGGDVTVRMTGDPARGDRSVEITSLGGEIDLVVPEGLSMSVDIELAFTREHEGDYRIVSDFPLQQTTSPDWDTEQGTARKTIRGTGSIAGGTHGIRIRTINGNVRLRRE